jgi:hypothetical protein
MTLSSPRRMRRASINSPDYADLASPKPLLRKGSSVNVGIIQRSA